ncbi:hypothetical protein QZH41_010171, partial [Actinostola sp. cb2023]
KCKENTHAAIRNCLPRTPAPPLISSDPPWTPGQWRARESSSSSDEEPTQNTLNVYNEAITKIAALSNMKTEPLSFRLASEWETATEAEKLLCEKQVDEACQVVCKVIAPNASKELFDAYRHSSKSENELDALTTAYRHAPTKNSKTQILSIYALRYSSTMLKKIHAPFENLSDRQIKKAKAHAKTVGAGMSFEKTPFHRVRFDLAKLNHFLTFIDEPYFYQDVAYGTRQLKLESGEKVIMPNVVRTVGRSTMIEQYLKQCGEEGFGSLGRSTLFRILKVREASQRKSLKGLDNIAASGADVFDTLHKITDDVEQMGARPEWCEDTHNKLKEGKRYLKTDYRAHSRDTNSPCPDHCRRYALSDTYDNTFKTSCEHDHHLQCDRCESLKSTMKKILTEIESQDISFYSREQQQDLLHDAGQARDMVFQWKAHLIRAENQDQAKRNLLKSLQSDTILVVLDWAMKFTQMKYREKQCEWFGKRGMNWHVSCIISKPANHEDLQIVSYVHLFDSCTQDWYAVCAILTHLLKIVKATQPKINKAFIRSDGAGCYHNNNLIAAVNDVGNQTGIKVLRYDFSEPQFGKDVCDRIISPLKGAIRRYCDEGHDILSASDMYVTLQARPVTGTTAAVCELNRRAINDFKLNRVNSFSTFHNFMYEAEGLRISKAYNIGTGNLIPWSELNIQGQCPITLDELDGQGFNTVPSRNLKFQVPSSAEKDEVEEENTLFQCKEAGCSYAFNKFEDLEDHICIGEHDMETNNQDNLYDQLRREWALKFSTVSFDPKERLQPMKELSECPIASEGESITAGWALQKPRGGRTMFSEKKI